MGFCLQGGLLFAVYLLSDFGQTSKTSRAEGVCCVVWYMHVQLGGQREKAHWADAMHWKRLKIAIGLYACLCLADLIMKTSTIRQEALVAGTQRGQLTQ